MQIAFHASHCFVPSQHAATQLRDHHHDTERSGRNMLDATFKKSDPNRLRRRWLDRLIAVQRERLHDAFTQFRYDTTGNANVDTVLEVGLAQVDAYDTSKRLATARRQVREHRVTGLDLFSASFRLPFRDQEFAWVSCNTVLEHVGDDEQFALLKEFYRVADKGVFVTTVNRWHPLDFSTGFTFLHWLPPSWRTWHPSEHSARYLLNAATLYRLATQLPGTPRHDVGHKRVWGIKAHFFLMIERSATRQTLNPSDRREFGT
jgi:hypothetical protein